MILLETFDDRGVSRDKRLIENSTTIRIEVDKYGGVTILSPEQFCKTCNGSGGVRYHYEQDSSISCVCPVCNNGDLKRWEREKINWAEHNN